MTARHPKRSHSDTQQLASSFRDPSGFVFMQGSAIYRQVNTAYAAEFDHLMSSGLYDDLVKQELIVSHVAADIPAPCPELSHAVIKPERIPFISYPYEWSFSELKDAALATLAVQNIAFRHGMVLKDASAYNIQFRNGKPVFIDTLSFERYQEGAPWVAYRQFCQHFLLPLVLMAKVDVRLQGLLRVHLDGIPLGLGAKLLPWHLRLRPSYAMHIVMHARAQEQYGDRSDGVPKRRLNTIGFSGIIDSLSSMIRSLNWQPEGTEWADYYENTNYSAGALGEKERIVDEFVTKTDPGVVWDVGANDGRFSIIAAQHHASVLAFDIDPAVVEKGYRSIRMHGPKNVLPLIFDITNPAPAIGWENKERPSLLERGPADVVLALALVHHLAISNNLPFSHIAQLFRSLCHTLIIEFVPKTDSKVQKLLATRKDIFPEYDKKHFEAAFRERFSIEEQRPVEGSERVLYLMRAR